MVTEKLVWEDLKQMSDEEIQAKAKQIVLAMTMFEKANQMAGDMNMLGMGWTMAFNGGYCGVPYPAGEDKGWGVEPLRFVDGPRGIVKDHATCFPVSMARGASFDVELEERIGEVIGIEGRSVGANYFGGVCINLLRHPAWGRAQETYGEDPVHLGEMGAALTRGVQKHMMACAKHYALNSMENMRFKVDVSVDERTLREVYLPHFKRCVDEGVASIMNAYNQVNGDYCGENHHLLTEILKDEWGFDGFVITDFIWGVRDAAKGINAGLDVEMPVHKTMPVKKITKLVNEGKVDEAKLDEAAYRHIVAKMRFAKVGNRDLYRPEQLAKPEHRALALEAAEKSMVLLKNEGNLLPLDQTTTRKIAVLGKLADIENTGDHGSSNVKPPYVITPLKGLQTFLGENKVVYNEGKNPEAAAQTAQGSDVALIVVGNTHKEEGEFISQVYWNVGGDRDSLELSPHDEALILAVAEKQPNTIVVMESGSAIITENWREKVPALIMGWYPGMEGGTALAKLLFGEVNPSGKLPCTFAKSEEDYPYFDKSAEKIEYGYYHGYHLLDKNGIEAAFPFGFGLSYTTFAYDHLKVDIENENVVIQVEVTNTGELKGDEVVQLYTSAKNSCVERFEKELKAFQRVSLHPGETKLVTFNLPVANLAYYDVDSFSWKVEATDYQVLVGAPGNGILVDTFVLCEP